MKLRLWFESFNSSLPRLLRMQLILPSVVIALLITLNFYSIHEIVTTTRPVIEEDLPASVHEGYMSTHFHEFLYWTMASNQPGITNDLRKERLDLAARAFAAFNKSVDEYSKLNVPQASRDYFDPIIEARRNLLKDIQASWKMADDVVKGTIAPTDLAAFLDTRLLAAATPIESGLENLAALHEVQQKQTQAAIVSAQKTTAIQATVLVLISAGLLFSLGLFLRNQILRLMREISDQLSQSFRSISNSSEDLKKVSSELSVSTTQALSSLTENAASLRSVDVLLERTADDTIRSVAGSQASLSSAHAGEYAVSAILEAMADIQQSSRSLEQFAIIVDKMRGQTKVIDDIVFKTQILSFNMAIEVARAGRAGRAFEVITKEMNSLAEVSGAASAEIGALLDDSADAVQTIIRGVRERLSTGQERAMKTNSVFHEILENVSELTTNVQNISDATKDQAESLRQVSISAGELNSMLSSNKGVVLRVESASTQLNSEAQQFEQTLERLTRALGDKVNKVA